MPIIDPPSREELDSVARVLEEAAAKLRAADPEDVYAYDSVHEVTQTRDGRKVVSDSWTVRVDWTGRGPL